MALAAASESGRGAAGEKSLIRHLFGAGPRVIVIVCSCAARPFDDSEVRDGEAECLLSVLWMPQNGGVHLTFPAGGAFADAIVLGVTFLSGFFQRVRLREREIARTALSVGWKSVLA